GAVEIAMLRRMRINLDVPVARQLLDRTDVVEMTVGEDDSARARVRGEARGRSIADRSGGAGDVGVDQHPLPVPCPRQPVEHDIDQGGPAIGEVWRDLTDVVVADLLRRAGGIVERQLAGHRGFPLAHRSGLTARGTAGSRGGGTAAPIPASASGRPGPAANR